MSFDFSAQELLPVQQQQRQKLILPLDEEPKTLEDLSQKYSISRERVRQIENKAIKKLQEEIKLISETKLLPKN